MTRASEFTAHCHHDGQHDGHHDGHHEGDLEDHDLGLSHDLPRIAERQGLLGRRRLLAAFGGLGASAALVACGTDPSTTTIETGRDAAAGAPPAGGPGGGQGGGPGGTGAESSVEVAEGEIPEETAGPYPGDGSNGVNVLAESGVVRSDITSSFGDASGVADGVPVTVRMKVYDLSGDDATPLAGAAIYLWHCDAAGDYSMYSQAVVDENYLRGVQVADADGRVEFTSIFPGCYSGRWPHMHFEVYESEAAATSYTNKLRTSQLALPQDVSEDVYADARYSGSAANLAAISLDSDNVFSDGYSLQMASVTGSVDDGYTVTLNVPV
jgi:protocatechuate 3,4-dioxygenase beta subunit